MKAAIIDVEGVYFSRDGLSVLENIHFQVFASEFVGIIGPNAGGKTTLLQLLLGILQPDRGRIRVLGKAPGQAVISVGYVPQHPSFSRDFPISVGEVVMLGALNSEYAGNHDAVVSALQTVGLEGLAGQRISTLSGGQLQRVMIARALVSHPHILLLDESTTNVDAGAEQNLFALLNEYNKDMSVVLVSHDISFISSYVSRVACLNKTLVCHETEALTSELIEAMYKVPIRYIQHGRKM